MDALTHVPDQPSGYKNMIRILFVLLISMVLTPAHATSQIPENIVYKNTEYESLDEPLTAYLKENKIEIHKITKTLCSANWRGYVSKWVVREDSLYLKEIYGNACGKKTIILIGDIISGAKGLVEAKWFSGEIKLYEKGKVYSNQPPTYVLKFNHGKIEK